MFRLFSRFAITALIIISSCTGVDDKQQKAKNKLPDSAKTQKKNTTTTVSLTGTSWEGQWHKHTNSETDQLTISDVKSESFRFKIEAAYGANVGELEGVAIIKGNHAVAVVDNCSVDFTYESNSTISVKTQNCNGGLNVSYDGDYLKSPKIIATISTPRLKSVFVDKKILEQFEEVVQYDNRLFEERLQEVSEDKDLDNLNFTVVKGGVSGLYTIMECIIMYDKRGRFLLAAIDDDLVRYYTNIPEFERKLPKTIEEWRTPFKEKHLAYMGDQSKN